MLGAVVHAVMYSLVRRGKAERTQWTTKGPRKHEMFACGHEMLVCLLQCKLDPGGGPLNSTGISSRTFFTWERVRRR